MNKIQINQINSTDVQQLGDLEATKILGGFGFFMSNTESEEPDTDNEDDSTDDSETNDSEPIYLDLDPTISTPEKPGTKPEDFVSPN